MNTLSAHVIDHKATDDLAPCDEFYRHAYFDAPVGIARVSTEGLFLDVNPALCALMGYAQQALIGRGFFDFVYAEMPTSRDTLSRFITQEVTRLTLEKRYRHGAGHESWVKVNISSWSGLNGQPLYFIYVFEDITDHKAVELELQIREIKYRTVMAASPEGFCLVDMTGQLLEVNDAYCRLSGYSREELMDMNISQLDTVDSPSDIAKRLAEVRLCGNLTYTSRHRRKDGTDVSLLISTTYAPDISDQVFYFFTISVCNSQPKMKLSS
jgi:PAS domain S-box-containing protein